MSRARGLLAGLAIASLGASIYGFAAPVRAEQDAWNPFAEQDRQAAIRKRSEPRPTPGADPRGPYLPPMTSSDTRENRASGEDRAPPQPYPATPPGSAASPGYATRAPGQGAPYTGPVDRPVDRDDNSNDRAVGQSPAAVIPYGAPGTYAPHLSEPGTGNFGAAPITIERGELTPVISAKGALPAGIWQGLDAAAAEQLLTPVRLPPASPALSDLLNRIMAEPVADPKLNAVRIMALLKAGQAAAAARLRSTPAQNAPPSVEPDLLEEIVQARLDLATNQSEQGCARIKSVVGAQSKLPKHIRGEAIILAGYCAVLAGNRQAAGLAAELARDAGYTRPFTLALLEAIASKSSVRAPLPETVSTIDGMLVLTLENPDNALIEGMLQRAEPGFLHQVAIDPKSPPARRLLAAERAASANILAPNALADAYRAAAADVAAGASPNGANPGAAFERARHFQDAERQQAQFAKTRAIRALLDSARRDGLYHPVAVAVAPLLHAMRPAQEISWFTETAIETLAASGDYRAARQWARSAQPAENGAGTLDHWLMLLDIADPDVDERNRGRSITVLENLGIQGRFSQPSLHRLATVLDALDYNVPIPLWNLASRSDQPNTGHLPETGILSAMKQASEARQIAATTLFALRTIAPTGTTATHLLGLGDTLRALKRVGLEKDARRLGFEALFGDWPRTGG